ncbi:YSIRK-targeted surface antigen transcriptional regulator [Staphylococcus simulans]|uniref:YSIRK-targeted surface antigen transcriptional regulator n=1 Tax=Staphylococcus simulans TaxID=1286 RepID=UPI000D026AA4|nr:YSIRK-targeted surface antigen transcriptional regulator [Staphylococcus simulans]
MKETAILKSLHVCLGINVKAYDSNLNEIQEYTSKKHISPQYNELDLIKSVERENERLNCFILTGSLDEVFLLHYFEEKYYLFGPLKVNCLPSEDCFEKYLKDQNINIKFKHAINDYVQALKVYSLEDLKDIIKLVDYLFTSDTTDNSFEPIHNYAMKLQKMLDEAGLEKLFFIENDIERKKLEYEKQVLKLVRQGSMKKLKKSLSDLEGGIMPVSKRDSIRSEKNYSIIVFEKLSQLAIESGMDVLEATRTRDQMIIDNEAAKSFSEIMKVRNGAIVFFTKKISEIVDEEISPFLSSILSYINKNLYNELTIESIAKEFNISQTTLNLNFKNELGMTVKKYITKSKLEDAKKLLDRNLSISEISQMLGYADSSHFCKKFKKEFKMTPTQYRRNTKS